MKLFDTHCHLNDESLYRDLESVVSRALQTGVDKMVVIGWDEASSKLAIQIAEQYPFIYACVGFHPENIEDVSEKTLENVLKLSSHPKVVGIGEIGLDYHWEKDPVKREKQKESILLLPFLVGTTPFVVKGDVHRHTPRVITEVVVTPTARGSLLLLRCTRTLWEARHLHL